MICKCFPVCLDEQVCKALKYDTECLEVQTKIAHCQQNHRRYKLWLDSGTKALKYEVDGHMLCGNDQIKCDNLILTAGCSSGDKAVFIELKGSDLHHAYDQLLTTINIVKPIVSNKHYKYYARIIHTGSNHKTNNNVKERLNRLLAKANGSKGLFVKEHGNSFLQENLSNL